MIKRSKDEVTVVEGNPLFLVCEAEGFPVPLVTWTMDGKLLQSSTSETDFVIHDATKKDQGHYKCDASNSSGTASYTATVEVTIKGDYNHIDPSSPSWRQLRIGNFALKSSYRCTQGISTSNAIASLVREPQVRRIVASNF